MSLASKMEPQKHRCRHDIKRIILNGLRENGPTKQYHVMVMAPLAHKQLKQYEETMTKEGLVTVSEGYWAITEKGKRMLATLEAAN